MAWGYDSLNRLTSEVRTGTNAFTAGYTLDAVGNWTSRTVNGSATSYTYSNADRILTAGSTSYSWNDTGTLASRTSGGTTTFCLDGQAVVLEKQGSTITANYTYGNSLLTRNGETQHFHGHGSLRATTSSSPYQYGRTSGYCNDGECNGRWRTTIGDL